MDNKINEKYLIVLKKDSNSQIFIDYENIENPLEEQQKQFNHFFSRTDATLKDLISHIESNVYLEKLCFKHKYCKTLVSTYQIHDFSNAAKVKQISEKIALFEFRTKTEENFNEFEETSSYFEEIQTEYQLRFNSYAINSAYKKCIENNNIIAFSHRSAGWSNPIYQLNQNFSIEIKTNFGFGHSSYFFTIIKYKNIEITPFSDWINYEVAKFSDIVRYTRSYTRFELKGTYNGKDVYKLFIENSFWELAMNFAKTACNLSLDDETKFIERYIIEECEEMVIGLENILLNNKFNFKHRETDKYYEVDKKGHYLMELRGEKISGSLSFINKILEFRNITSVDKFITRLENCNLKIQPHLIKELEIIKLKLDELNNDLSILKPEYDKVVIENQTYNSKFNVIKSEVWIKCKNEKVESIYIEGMYLKKIREEFPEYSEFKDKFDAISERYKILNQKIGNLNLVYSKIREYEKNITMYFHTK